MVLYLFCPLIVHSIAAGLVIARVLFPMIGGSPYSVYAFRIIYGFFAIFATYLSYSAFRFLFILANKRLIWLNGRVRRRSQPNCTRAELPYECQESPNSPGTQFIHHLPQEDEAR